MMAAMAAVLRGRVPSAASRHTSLLEGTNCGLGPLGRGSNQAALSRDKRARELLSSSPRIRSVSGVFHHVLLRELPAVAVRIAWKSSGARGSGRRSCFETQAGRSTPGAVAAARAAATGSPGVTVLLQQRPQRLPMPRMRNPRPTPDHRAVGSREPRRPHHRCQRDRRELRPDLPREGHPSAKRLRKIIKALAQLLDEGEG
jgi:hypothetical protein